MVDMTEAEKRLLSATDAERKLLMALADMCNQYLLIQDGSLDHMCMSAGEEAVELLASYGLVDEDGRGGTWTAAGRTLLEASFQIALKRMDEIRELVRARKNGEIDINTAITRLNDIQSK